MLCTRTCAAITVAVWALALFAGCSSSSEVSGGNSPATSAAANKDFNIATPEGSASLSLDGNLPPGWPSGFPVPNGATPAGSGSLRNSSSDLMIGAYTVAGTPQITFDFYRASTDYAVTQSKNVGVDDAFLGTVQFSGAYAGSVTTTGHGSNTYIVIVLKNTAGPATTAG